jgi:hypothetical protein
MIPPDSEQAPFDVRPLVCCELAATSNGHARRGNPRFDRELLSNLRMI